MASRKLLPPRTAVYQDGRGSEPMIDVGSVFPADALNIFLIPCLITARNAQNMPLPTVDTANRPWPTSVAPRRVSSDRVARGPVAPRKMACRPLAGKASISGSRLSTRARGAACSLPLSNLWRVETMTRTELIIQLLKIAIGLAFGAYFVLVEFTSIGPINS